MNTDVCGWACRVIFSIEWLRIPDEDEEDSIRPQPQPGLISTSRPRSLWLSMKPIPASARLSLPLTLFHLPPYVPSCPRTRQVRGRQPCYWPSFPSTQTSKILTSPIVYLTVAVPFRELRTCFFSQTRHALAHRSDHVGHRFSYPTAGCKHVINILAVPVGLTQILVHPCGVISARILGGPAW